MKSRRATRGWDKSMRRLCVLVLLALIIPLHAQENEHLALTLNTPIQVQVTADKPGVLIYENSTSGSVFTIETRALSEAFDSVVWVVDVDNHLLAYNDNALVSGEIETNAYLANLTLIEAGRYTIYVDSFNGVSEGEVEVVLREHDIFAVVVEETDNATIITASLPEDSVFAYPLVLEAPEILTITARDISGTLDPYLRIVDSSGNILISNDDHHSTDLTLNLFDAQIAEWEAPENATYTIEVLDFLGRAGEIEVQIERHP